MATVTVRYKGLKMECKRHEVRRTAINLVREIHPEIDDEFDEPNLKFSSSENDLLVESDAISSDADVVYVHYNKRAYLNPRVSGCGGASQALFALSSKEVKADSTSRITLDEVAQHCTVNDAWVIYNGNVYDVTEYAQIHPGGARLLLSCAGKDCTRTYNKYHPWVNGHAILRNKWMGRLAGPHCGSSLEAPLER